MRSAAPLEFADQPAALERAGHKCPDDEGEAAYEPGDPSQRPAVVDLDGLGPYEITTWTTRSMFCLFGVGLLLLRRRRWPDDSSRQAKAAVKARATLVDVTAQREETTSAAQLSS